jgi:hypothetical protein
VRLEVNGFTAVDWKDWEPVAFVKEINFIRVRRLRFGDVETLFRFIPKDLVLMCFPDALPSGLDVESAMPGDVIAQDLLAGPARW